jgi:hypothetical protein
MEEWPDWYLAGCLRSMADFVRWCGNRTPTDEELLTLWNAYAYAAPAPEPA